MTQGDDRLLPALARLPLTEPGAEWEIQLRARCHAAVSRRASRRAGAGKNLFATPLPDLAAAAALFIYLVAVFAEVVRLAGY